MSSAVNVSIVDAGEPASDTERLTEVVRATLSFAGRDGLEVAVRITGDREIGAIHDQFLGDPSPTDVMSFDLGDSVDVVVNVEQARREAAVGDHAGQAELALYVVHGLLHVCGFDDHDPIQRRRMRAAEQQVLRRLGIQVRAVDAE